MGTTSTGSEPRRTCIGARIDIETKSATPIDAGSYRYAEDLHFEALVISYSPIWRYPGGTERLGAIRTLDQRNAQQVATFQRILTEPRFQKHAFNANFERVALSRWLNMPTGFYLDPENWRCSAVLANVHGVFGTLDEVARAVRSPIQKDPEGRRLIKLFSVPETRKRTGVPDNNPFHSPGPGDCWCGQNHVADFGKFRAYCENDVRTEALVAASFPGMPPELQAEYEADQRINDRGVRHFKGLSEAAVRQVEAERDRLMGELKARTGLANPNSIQQMRGWLDDQGYPMLSLAKEPREEALADPSCPPHVAEVLQLKGNASLSSVAKHQAALKQRSGDGRVRGAFRFYGAHTGREAGRGIQPQNLPRYEASDADRRRLLFGAAGRDAPRIAKGTVRSSLVPAKGHVFVVCDYNAIEARVLGAFAGEKWVEAEFRGAGKIYEATAETVLGVPKQRIIAARAKCEECGKCEECAVRQQAKVACIAEGQLVLTDRGEVPIERVSRNDLVWDGVEWVRHDGAVCLGTKEVITHDGLTATPDHRVWCPSGDGAHVAFGDAADRGDGLVQSGSGRRPVQVGDRYRDRAEVHQTQASRGVRPGALRRVLPRVLVRLVEHQEGNRGLRLVRGHRSQNPEVAGPEADGGEAAVHEPTRSAVPQLRGEGDRVPVRVSAGSRAVGAGESPGRAARPANRPRGQRGALRARQHADGPRAGEPGQQAVHELVRVRPAVLALRRVHRAATAVLRAVAGSDHRSREASRGREAEGVAPDRVEARVYDLLNAGPRHRYTVQGRLVHNCLALGYAGGAGALVTMGAEGAGIDCGNYKELHTQWLALGAPGKFHEWNRDAHHYPALLALRDAYRDNSPATVRFWKQCAMAWDLAAVTGSPSTWGQNECLQMVRDGRHNRLVLPSGRSIWYRFARSHADPENPERIDRRTFIGKSSGVGHSRTDTHGGKLTENLTQAGARDVMFDLLMQIEQMTAGGWPGRTVMHVHDEVVIETPERSADRVLQDTLGLMSTSPTWAPFLPVKGGGKIMERYGK